MRSTTASCATFICAIVHLCWASPSVLLMETQLDGIAQPRRDVYPPYPLSFTELTSILMQNKNVSRPYYEIYSLDPKDPSFVPALPVLRKVAIRWNLNESGFTNNYAGWFPGGDHFPASCISNEISLTTSGHKFLQFKFKSEFPIPEPHVGTIFSSNPERYHINWYCPESQLVQQRGHLKCLSNLRMSIYSAYGPNGLPWSQIVDDLRKNKAPAMSDPRWVMTHDAPKQCTT